MRGAMVLLEQMRDYAQISEGRQSPPMLSHLSSAATHAN